MSSQKLGNLKFDRVLQKQLKYNVAGVGIFVYIEYGTLA